MISLKELPEVKGKLHENVSLSKRSFFGSAGSARFLFEPLNMDDLVFFLRNIPQGLNVIPLGAMSNVLVRSGGIDGVVIVFGEWFKKIYENDEIFEVGCAVPCTKLSTLAMDRELGGFEFMMGIPGTIGGALKMNAGCFGSSICDLLVECEGVTSEGEIKWFKKKDLNAGYRHTDIPDDCIITRAWLKGTPVKYSIPKKVNELMAQRRDSQPLGAMTCGSVFKNPEGFKAWQLIEEAGCRGLKIGDAQVSEKHCNFIVNNGEATPEDIENLGELVIQKVLDSCGVRLEWEIVRLGTK